MSGVGKTTAVEKVLSLYPQQILHTKYKGKPLFLTQLVWAKIDCPFDGSLKGLCLSFFAYVDRILGTGYSKKFSSDRMTVDAALPRMAQIATTHCLGLLVIDEIQHLSPGEKRRLGQNAEFLRYVGQHNRRPRRADWNHKGHVGFAERVPAGAARQRTGGFAVGQDAKRPLVGDHTAGNVEKPVDTKQNPPDKLN
ncbi:MAG: ATP-binding protein [Thermincola sp.]|nr:ATP-binding protein [Thermincola sp.]